MFIKYMLFKIGSQFVLNPESHHFRISDSDDAAPATWILWQKNDPERSTCIDPINYK